MQQSSEHIAIMKNAEAIIKENPFINGEVLAEKLGVTVSVLRGILSRNNISMDLEREKFRKSETFKTMMLNGEFEKLTEITGYSESSLYRYRMIMFGGIAGTITHHVNNGNGNKTLKEWCKILYTKKEYIVKYELKALNVRYIGQPIIEKLKPRKNPNEVISIHILSDEHMSKSINGELHFCIDKYKKYTY